MDWMQVVPFTLHLYAKIKAFNSLRGKIQLKVQLSWFTHGPRLKDKTNMAIP